MHHCLLNLNKTLIPIAPAVFSHICCKIVLCQGLSHSVSPSSLAVRLCSITLMFGFLSKFLISSPKGVVRFFPAVSHYLHDKIWCFLLKLPTNSLLLLFFPLSVALTPVLTVQALLPSTFFPEEEHNLRFSKNPQQLPTESHYWAQHSFPPPPPLPIPLQSSLALTVSSSTSC